MAPHLQQPSSPPGSMRVQTLLGCGWPRPAPSLLHCPSASTGPAQPGAGPLGCIWPWAETGFLAESAASREAGAGWWWWWWIIKQKRKSHKGAAVSVHPSVARPTRVSQAGQCLLGTFGSGAPFSSWIHTCPKPRPVPGIPLPLPQEGWDKSPDKPAGAGKAHHEEMPWAPGIGLPLLAGIPRCSTREQEKADLSPLGFSVSNWGDSIRFASVFKKKNFVPKYVDAQDALFHQEFFFSVLSSVHTLCKPFPRCKTRFSGTEKIWRSKGILFLIT